MENYVEKLMPIINVIGGEVSILYRMSGRENSPIYPLLNYASMCAMMKYNDSIMSIKRKGYTYRDYNECKEHGMRCLMENMHCILQTNYSTDSFMTYIPTYNADANGNSPFSFIDANAAFTSLTTKRQTLMSTFFNKYASGVSVERLDGEVYEWTAGLYTVMSECFGRTFDTYVSYIGSIPQLKDLKRVLKDSPNIQEMLPLKEHISIDDAVQALYNGNFQGKCVLYGKTDYERKKVVYIDTDKAMKIYMSEGTLNMEMYPYSLHGEGKAIGTLKPLRMRDVADVYTKVMTTIRQRIEAISRQKQRMLEMCGIKA